MLIPAPGSGVTPHLWIVVTEPDDRGICIIVNLTTLRHGQDQTVTIAANEHPFVNRPTSVRYSDARLADIHKLRGEVARGLAVQKASCSSKLLKLVQDGVCASPYTPNKIVEFYRAWKEARGI